MLDSDVRGYRKYSTERTQHVHRHAHTHAHTHSHTYHTHTHLPAHGSTSTDSPPPPSSWPPQSSMHIAHTSPALAPTSSLLSPSLALAAVPVPEPATRHCCSVPWVSRASACAIAESSRAYDRPRRWCSLYRLAVIDRLITGWSRRPSFCDRQTESHA